MSSVVFITYDPPVCHFVPEPILQPRIPHNTLEYRLQLYVYKNKKKLPPKIAVQIPKGKQNKGQKIKNIL